MDENGGADHKELGVAEPGEVSAHVVAEGVARLAADIHQHQLD